MARIGVQRWSLNRRQRACATLCYSLCTTARSPVVFPGNKFISLMRLDIYDHMISIILIFRPFAGHKRTSITALARKLSLILAWRQLYLPMHDYQCVAHHEAWWCDQYIYVQLLLGLRNVNYVQFSVIADTSPYGVCHCEGDLWLHWAWRHVDLRRHILPSVESRCAVKWLELSFPFYWGQ